MKPNWKSLLSRRLLIRSIDITQTLLMEVVLLEVTESGLMKFVWQPPETGKPALVMWQKQNLFDVVEVMPDDTAMAHTREAVEIYNLILALTKDDTSAVTILCDNEEGSGPDNCAVEVNAEWTKWEEVRFYAQTKRLALVKALAAQQAACRS